MFIICYPDVLFSLGSLGVHNLVLHLLRLVLVLAAYLLGLRYVQLLDRRSLDLVVDMSLIANLYGSLVTKLFPPETLGLLNDGVEVAVDVPRVMRVALLPESCHELLVLPSSSFNVFLKL